MTSMPAVCKSGWVRIGLVWLDSSAESRAPNPEKRKPKKLHYLVVFHRKKFKDPPEVMEGDSA